MNNPTFRARQIITKDRVMDVASLSAIITNEVADRLSHILAIKDSFTRIRVEKNGELSILVSLKAEY